MDFCKVVNTILEEDLVSGGEVSVFGPNVATNSPGAFSADTYAPGDARQVHGLYAGVLTRRGLTAKKKKGKKKKGKK